MQVDNTIRISVKREQMQHRAGVVSNFLHDAEIGTAVEVSAPAGLFTLVENNSPVLFISGGVGVTPLQSMVQTLENRPASFIQCARNANVAAFTETVQAKVAALGGTYKAVYSDTEGYFNEIYD